LILENIKNDKRKRKRKYINSNADYCVPSRAWQTRPIVLHRFIELAVR